MSEIIGGVSAIQKNIHYPEKAKKDGIEGKVYITAFINENGDVVKTKVMKSIGGGCDKEAAKAVKNAKFSPAINNGKAVKSQVVVPVMFKLSDKK